MSPGGVTVIVAVTTCCPVWTVTVRALCAASAATEMFVVRSVLFVTTGAEAVTPVPDTLTVVWPAAKFVFVPVIARVKFVDC